MLFSGMLPKLVAILTTSIFLVSVQGQVRFNNNNDSLLFLQADTAFSLASQKSDSILTLTKGLLKKSKSAASNLTLANIYNAMGWAYLHTGFLDSSVNSLTTAWQYFTKAKDTNGIIRVSINISEVYTKQNQIANAIQFLTQADSLCILTGNIPFHTNVQRQLGVVYREAKDYERSAEYLNNALNGFLQMEDYHRYLSTGISLSILYRYLKMPDSSLAILNKCTGVINLYESTPYQRAMLQEHIAESYFQKENFTKALVHYTNAYTGFKEINNKADIAYEAMNIGKALWKLGRIKEADQYLVEAFKISDTLKMINYQYDIAQTISSLHGNNNNWQKAYQYLSIATSLRDSIDFSNQIKLTNELKEKFEADKKETEIKLLKSQNEATEAENRKNRLLQYLFGVLFIASVIIGWLLFNRVSIKRKLNEQLLRNQIAGDLHDEIGSALSVIDISSRIALSKKDNAGLVTEQLQKIKQYASSTMDSMSDIVWSVNPGNDNLESVLTRVHEFAAEVCEPLDIQLEINMDNSFNRIMLDAVNRKHVLLLCKEAINNAVKYSHCSLLKINSDMKDKKMVQISVTDNGTGFNIEDVKRGNGLNNMKTRVAVLKGSLRIDSTVGKGTSVQFIFPVV